MCTSAGPSWLTVDLSVRDRSQLGLMSANQLAFSQLPRGGLEASSHIIFAIDQPIRWRIMHGSIGPGLSG
jgi:hypothetical protein